MKRLRRTLALVMVVVSCCLGGTVSIAQTLELRACRVTFPAGSVGTTIRETNEGKETILCGRGDATLSATRPFSRDRLIEFLAGRPVSTSASEDIRAEWKGTA